MSALSAGTLRPCAKVERKVEQAVIAKTVRNRAALVILVPGEAGLARLDTHKVATI